MRVMKKRQDYIAPHVSVETIMIASHLLTASDVYGGELGSRPGDATEFDETLDELSGFDKLLGQ